MSETQARELPNFLATEARLGGREAYETAKAADKTELDYRQWVQVRTPEFKAWFGDWENNPENASKVVNPRTGEPLVVYHGTRADFTAFDYDKSSTNTGNKGHFGQGFYLTPNYDLAQSFAFGGKVMPVFANLKNPLLNNAQHIGKVAEQMNIRRYEGKKIPEITQNGRRGSSFSHITASLGFDGVAQADAISEMPYRNELVVFNPTQIKSATHNSGRFDPHTHDIRDPLPDKPEHLPNNTQRPSETLQTASLHQAAEKEAPNGGLKQLQHYYRMHTATLPPEEKQRQTVLEHFMEKTVAGMPPPLQAQARANFYQTQIREAAQIKEIAAARHDDVGIDR